MTLTLTKQQHIVEKLIFEILHNPIYFVRNVNDFAAGECSNALEYIHNSTIASAFDSNLENDVYTLTKIIGERANNIAAHAVDLRHYNITDNINTLSAFVPNFKNLTKLQKCWLATIFLNLNTKYKDQFFQSLRIDDDQLIWCNDVCVVINRYNRLLTDYHDNDLVIQPPERMSEIVPYRDYIIDIIDILNGRWYDD